MPVVSEVKFSSPFIPETEFLGNDEDENLLADELETGTEFSTKDEENTSKDDLRRLLKKNSTKDTLNQGSSVSEVKSSSDFMSETESLSNDEDEKASSAESEADTECSTQYQENTRNGNSRKVSSDELETDTTCSNSSSLGGDGKNIRNTNLRTLLKKNSTKDTLNQRSSLFSPIQEVSPSKEYSERKEFFLKRSSSKDSFSKGDFNEQEISFDGDSFFVFFDPGKTSQIKHPIYPGKELSQTKKKSKGLENIDTYIYEALKKEIINKKD